MLGSPTGDGAINALRGKRGLRRLKTGRLVTDAGLALLHEVPAFKTWLGGDIAYDLMAFEGRPTNLLIDGAFTGKGLTSLTDLEGVFGLRFFWHTTALIPDDLKALAGLPNLGYLGLSGRVVRRHRHASHRGDSEPPHAHGPGDHSERRWLHRPQPISDNRVHLGPRASGLTQISDAGLETLAGMASLERIEFYECQRISDAGVARLASLPRLRELTVAGSPNVTPQGMSTIPASVLVNYS